MTAGCAAQKVTRRTVGLEHATQHAMQYKVSLGQFETRVVKLRDKDTYPLGNTKLMLHYFLTVLGFKVLAKYLSNIRDKLV